MALSGLLKPHADLDGPHLNRSGGLVAAVAHRRVAGLLARAEIGCLVSVRCPLLGRELRPLVRAVAEWLLLGLAARAPPIVLARLHFDRDGRGTCYNCLRHGMRSPERARMARRDEL